MANFDVSFVYQIIDKFSGPLKKMADQNAALQKQVAQTQRVVDTSVGRVSKGMSLAASGFRGLGNVAVGTFDLLARGLRGAGHALKDFGEGVGAATGALGALAIAFPVNRAMQFETAVADLDKAFSFENAGERSDFIQSLRDMAPGLARNSVEIAQVAYEFGKLGESKDD